MSRKIDLKVKSFFSINGLILISFIVFITISCDPNAFDGNIKDGNRDIVIDVDNSIFNAVDAVNTWNQGPGVDKIVFTIALEDTDGNAAPVEHTMLLTDLVSINNYTQLTVSVTGKLTQIDAQAFKGSTLLYSASIAASIVDKLSTDTFTGWEIFANVKKFKLGFYGNSDDWVSSYISLNIAPRGGNSVTYKVDSGVTAPVDQKTDWVGVSLTSRQLAIEPILNENPTDMTFDIYTLVVDSNIQLEYDPLFNNDANYEDCPWENVWTYEEITDTGKQIGNATYKLTKYNTGDPLPFIEPAGADCGYNSFLVDPSIGAEDDPLGKFLMFVLVMKYDTLSVPTAIKIVEIK